MRVFFGRIGWAFKCFFVVLFRGRLPAGAEDESARRALRGAETRAALPAASGEKAREPGPDGIATRGAVLALAVLQREGRLFDFLLEDIDAYEDGQIGAAVRAIHRGCRKALDDHFPLAPIIEAREEERVEVAAGFDPAAIRLVGNVAGAPPFSGVLRHHGWRVVAVNLPAAGGAEQSASVVAPAEVEVL